MARLARAEIFDPAEIVALHASKKRSALATSWAPMNIPASGTSGGAGRLRRRPLGRRPKWFLRFATIIYHPWWLASSSECPPD